RYRAGSCWIDPVSVVLRLTETTIVPGSGRSSGWARGMYRSAVAVEGICVSGFEAVNGPVGDGDVQTTRSRPTKSSRLLSAYHVRPCRNTEKVWDTPSS